MVLAEVRVRLVMLESMRLVAGRQDLDGEAPWRVYVIAAESGPVKVGIVAACFVTVLGLSVSHARADPCRELQEGSEAAPLLSPPLGKVVVGTGRLQLFSAPDRRCVMAGVFVVPHDDLTAYAETPSGWSSVLYINPRSGNSVQGWARSARLKTTGTEGPRQ